jgi:arylsulfatase A-like enzyme
MATPNVILIVYDQLAATWLEAGLRGAADLPNFARLAGGGTYFSRCFSTNPVCSPARASIATGLRSSAHGVMQLGYALSPEVPTFMGALAEAGWHTAACGKLHLRPHWESLDPDYRPYGFTEQHITEDPRGGPWLDWVRAEHPEHFRAVLTTVWAREMDEFSDYGPHREDLAELMAELPNPGNVYELPFPARVSQSNWITDRSLDAIAATPPGQSLLCQIGYVQPHNPYAPPRGFRRFVNFDFVPEPIPAAWRDDPLTPPAFNARAAVANRYEWRAAREHYFADMVHLDRQLGRVLDGLAEAGRERDTYVIALADHGDLLLDHGLIYKDSYHYDACIRVPLLISGPGLAQGQVRDDLVAIEDIYPTIMEAAGLPCPRPDERRQVPGQPVAPFAAGRSLLDLARGQAPADWPEAVFIESYNNLDSRLAGNWVKTVRTADARYSLYGDGAGEQLFDLAADPDEQENLAADPAHHALRTQMRDRLLEHLLVERYPHPPRDLFRLGVH